MTFDELVAPLGGSRFLAEHYRRRPAHLPATPGRPRLTFDWAHMNQLFAIQPHWTEGNLKLIVNSQPVAAEHYADEVPTADGPQRRADPAKVKLFLGMGASLVANAAEQVSPEIAEACAVLARQFTALVSANIYCSFDGVQAFATHYDTHEVFALQCEGEKTWRIYANRAADPIDHPHGEDAQALIDAARGPIAMQVTTRPGDLLYLPRGVYHDALAQSGASMHVTFAVAPRNGLVIQSLIERAMREDSAFRAYLPAPDEEGGMALAERLAELGDRLAELCRTPQFAVEVANEQRKVAIQRASIDLPRRPATDYYARTGERAELRRSANGVLLATAAGTAPTGAAFEAAEWALSRPAFSAAELDARYAYVPAEERRNLLRLLIEQRLIEHYAPQL